MAVIVYSKSDCPRCEQVKDFLSNHLIEHQVFSLDDEAIRNKFKSENPNVRSVPYVLINGGPIAGLEGLKKWYDKVSDK